MKLLLEDVNLFYKLYQPLLLFTNQRHPVEKSIADVDQLMLLPTDKRLAIREALFRNSELIEEFVASNPDQFSQQELEIVLSWKHYIKGRFYLLRQLKNYAVFLTAGGENKAYGVLALTDSFSEMMPFMPIIVDTVLLPFKGQIIYDGLLGSQHIYFGGGIKRSLNDSYNEAKAKNGIITTLGGAVVPTKVPNDIEQLKYYLRSERNRDHYWEDIQRLIRKSDENRTAYYQEIGKYYAKQYGKRLRELGIDSGWFGILENLVIGSGKTQKEALSNIKGIVSKNKINHVYLFQLKPKKSS